MLENGSNGGGMVNNCPTCGARFPNIQRLRKHHNNEHDRKLPNQECAQCGATYYAEHEKKFCSRQCIIESGTYAGENHPNYQGGKESTNCEICDREFEYYPSDKKGLYCSECVKTKQWQTIPRITGEDHPRWIGGKQEYSCTVCGNTVERYPSNAKSKAITCSETCRRKHLSESFAGEGHPNWKGGGNEAYGPGWAAARRKALERDDYRCRRCGTDRETLGRNPDVHHIVPVRRFIAARDRMKADAHTLDNLITLCPKCHRNADVGNISQSTLRALLSDEETIT